MSFFEQAFVFVFFFFSMGARHGCTALQSKSSADNLHGRVCTAFKYFSHNEHQCFKGMFLGYKLSGSCLGISLSFGPRGQFSGLIFKLFKLPI